MSEEKCPLPPLTEKQRAEIHGKSYEWKVRVRAEPPSAHTYAGLNPADYTQWDARPLPDKELLATAEKEMERLQADMYAALWEDAARLLVQKPNSPILTDIGPEPEWTYKVEYLDPETLPPTPLGAAATRLRARAATLMYEGALDAARILREEADAIEKAEREDTER